MTRSHALPKSIVATATAAAIVSAIGLTSAFASNDSTVELTVDGKTSTVALDGKTVADVLQDQKLVPGAHDLVSPSADTVLEDGDAIALRHAKQVLLTVDGKQKSVWVLADTVDQALALSGVSGKVYVSASRSRSLTNGLSLEVRTPKRVGISADGGGVVRTSTAGTVGEFLTQVRFVLHAGDTVTPALTTPLRPGLVAHVTRALTRVEAIAPGVTKVADPTSLVGTRTTVRAGVAGKARRTYALSTVAKGKQKAVVVSSTTLVAPVNGVVKVGTKAKPKPKPAPVSVDAGSIPSSGGLNWAAVARCESGGNPRTNTGNGYYGLYQFSLGTWRAVGGSGLPSDASAAEQTKRAQILYNRSGAGQWPVCGKKL